MKPFRQTRWWLGCQSSCPLSRLFVEPPGRARWPPACPSCATIRWVEWLMTTEPGWPSGCTRASSPWWWCTGAGRSRVSGGSTGQNITMEFLNSVWISTWVASMAKLLLYSPSLRRIRNLQMSLNSFPKAVIQANGWYQINVWVDITVVDIMFKSPFLTTSSDSLLAQNLQHWLRNLFSLIFHSVRKRSLLLASLPGRSWQVRHLWEVRETSLSFPYKSINL